MIAKYDKLDAQLQSVTFEYLTLLIGRLQQMCVTESMQNVMSGMTKIMSGATNSLKGKNYEETMKRFTTEK